MINWPANKIKGYLVFLFSTILCLIRSAYFVIDMIIVHIFRSSFVFHYQSSIRCCVVSYVPVISYSISLCYKHNIIYSTETICNPSFRCTNTITKIYMKIDNYTYSYDILTYFLWLIGQFDALLSICLHQVKIFHILRNGFLAIHMSGVSTTKFI